MLNYEQSIENKIKNMAKEYSDRKLPNNTLIRLFNKSKEVYEEAKTSNFIGSGGLVELKMKYEALKIAVKNIKN